MLVEALIRWRMPDGSFRYPDEFLAVAEESGLIVEISDWVLRTAICTAARWHRGAWPEARVAINVSPRQFLDYRFVSRLEELLREYELPARCLELELTESVLQTGAHTIKTLDQLRAIGVAVALDDFGTGYSSLASLQQLPLTRVKLDRSLIAGIDDGARSASIARATIALCRGLGLEVTAEGVERVEQLAMLLPHRAISLQGYLFSRPVSARHLLPLLERSRRIAVSSSRPRRSCRLRYSWWPARATGARDRCRWWWIDGSGVGRAIRMRPLLKERGGSARTGAISFMSKTIVGDDGKARCRWCSAAPEFLHYHDTRVGLPRCDDRRLFEKLALEGFQSGLSWRTILAKRENFRAAFLDFDIEQVARFGARDVKRLLATPASFATAARSRR